MNIKYKKILRNIGLSKSEAEVYVASLFLGPSSVIKIAQKARLTRQLVYDLLPGLIEKGLIKEVKIGAKSQYQALDPERLQDRVREISKDVDNLVPLLKSRQATSAAIPEVTIYENPMAMREWYEMFMKQAKKGEEMLVWSSGVSWIELDRDFYLKYLKHKNKLNIQGKTISPDNEASRRLYQELGQVNGVYRFSPEWWQHQSEKWTWRDNICYLTIRENATNMIVIKSEELAAIERYDFYRIWDRLK